MLSIKKNCILPTKWILLKIFLATKSFKYSASVCHLEIQNTVLKCVSAHLSQKKLKTAKYIKLE
jgi:hypothetical protein